MRSSLTRAHMVRWPKHGAQVLEEKPTNAVDLQELSLLAKKTAFDGKETSPLLPIPVRLLQAFTLCQLSTWPHAPAQPSLPDLCAAAWLPFAGGA